MATRQSRYSCQPERLERKRAKIGPPATAEPKASRREFIQARPQPARIGGNVVERPTNDSSKTAQGRAAVGPGAGGQTLHPLQVLENVVQGWEG